MDFFKGHPLLPAAERTPEADKPLACGQLQQASQYRRGGQQARIGRDRLSQIASRRPPVARLIAQHG
jgi:hypothetical protein